MKVDERHLLGNLICHGAFTANDFAQEQAISPNADLTSLMVGEFAAKSVNEATEYIFKKETFREYKDYQLPISLIVGFGLAFAVGKGLGKNCLDWAGDYAFAFFEPQMIKGLNKSDVNGKSYACMLLGLYVAVAACRAGLYKKRNPSLNMKAYMTYFVAANLLNMASVIYVAPKIKEFAPNNSRTETYIISFRVISLLASFSVAKLIQKVAGQNALKINWKAQVLTSGLIGATSLLCLSKHSPIYED